MHGLTESCSRPLVHGSGYIQGRKKLCTINRFISTLIMCMRCIIMDAGSNFIYVSSSSEFSCLRAYVCICTAFRPLFSLFLLLMSGKTISSRSSAFQY
ncbi:hypothetical protein BDZ91DRAFT_747469 [Kalaharituber pfeilii]|nr:hypothetical protein BDZ91DRAFT_747469 [Kalaharituber pfeilii]